MNNEEFIKKENQKLFTQRNKSSAYKKLPNEYLGETVQQKRVLNLCFLGAVSNYMELSTQ